MHLGPDKKNHPAIQPPGVEVDSRAFETFTIRATDPFSRYILHYGVKAVALAAIAHRALEHIEESREGGSKVRELFKLREDPLSMSLVGLRSMGVIVPTPALTTSQTFWPHATLPADRLELAHPDLLNPLLANPVGGSQRAVPHSFFQLNWSNGDLLDRSKMGALFVVADRIWESSVGLFRSRIPEEKLLVGAIEQLVNYYSGTIAGMKLGAARAESLGAGETFLAGLVRRDQAIAQKVLDQSARFAALTTDDSPLAGTLPPRPFAERSKRVPPAHLNTDRPLSPQEKHEVDDLARLSALNKLIHDRDPENRSEGLALIRRWQGDFSPRVARELNRSLKEAARLEQEFLKIDSGREIFEQGDTAEGIRIVREIAARSSLPLIKQEAQRLLKTFGRVLTALARTEEPTDEWPKAGARRRLIDVVEAAFKHGSDAEVIGHDGLKRYGRLAFGGISPTSLKLFDCEHEITWDIDLTTIQQIRFFYDKEPYPHRETRRPQP